MFRPNPDFIYVAGGNGAVSPSVEASLSQIAPVERIKAADRYGTSLAVSRIVFDSAAFAVIATGADFPDALSASGVAGMLAGPVILVNGKMGSVPSSVVKELRRLGVDSVMIAGGTGVVSKGIQNQLSNEGFYVDRQGKADRYATAAAINDAYFGWGAENVFLATGTQFPDALAGVTSSPLYISRPDCMPDVVRSSVDSIGAASKVALGGRGALSDAAVNGGKCPVKPPTTKPPTTGPPPGAKIVTPGAWCKKSEAGQIGYTVTGQKMTCKTTATDSRLRWRA